MPAPWWHDELRELSVDDASACTIGRLWHLGERLQLLRENVDASERASERWSSFVARETVVRSALATGVARESGTIREGGFSKAAFRAHWEGLGFRPNARGAGTPADDYLDALYGTSRLDVAAPGASTATVNLGSRASRVSDVLSVVHADADDVVFDLGSGSGKFALTFAASAGTTVRGVEFLEAPVVEARASSAALGLSNLSFDHADARDVDLSGGTIFYLYFPFRGEVAATVAHTLGTLARDKEVTVYFSGPERDFGEFFRREVDAGAFRELERRGEFGEVGVLASARG